MDIATLIGLLMGFGAIFGGAAVEGLHMKALIQPTAAMIVLGGTFGAAFVSFPLPAIIKAFKKWRSHLLGAHFEVLTDHRTLEYFQSQKEMLR